jgi:hypothetical protein
VRGQLECEKGFGTYEDWWELFEDVIYSPAEFCCYGCGKTFEFGTKMRFIHFIPMDGVKKEGAQYFSPVCVRCGAICDELERLGVSLVADEGFVPKAAKEYANKYGALIIFYPLEGASAHH